MENIYLSLHVQFMSVHSSEDHMQNLVLSENRTQNSTGGEHNRIAHFEPSRFVCLEHNGIVRGEHDRITCLKHHHHHHQSLNREGRWGTADDFATSFLHFSLFSTALWDLANSRPVHSLMLFSHLFLCMPCLLPPFTVPCKMVLARPDERET